MIIKKHKKDRKAWIRIVEAFLAILIIMGAVLIILSKEDTKVGITDIVYEKQSQILKIITENEDLRSEILLNDNSGVNNQIAKMIPGSWNFSTSICDINSVCPNSAGVYDEDVYVTESLVMSNLTYHSPKKIRFFVWMK